MIEHYALFNHHEDNNTLLILFSDKKITRKDSSGEVTLLFNEKELIGYSIDNFIRIAKIKYSGIIFLPNDILLDAINSLLINSSLEPLAYKKESGYVTKRVDNKIVVYATEGTFLRDETISKGHICTFFDLYIKSENENDIIVLDDDVSLNIDFFQMEEK